MSARLPTDVRIFDMAFDEQLQRAFDTVADRLRNEIVRELQSVASELIGVVRSDDRSAAPEARPENIANANQRLVDAIRSIGRARSLSEILDTLVNCAGREVSRASIIVVRGGRFCGWRFVGFGPSFDEADRAEFGPESAGIILDALRTGNVISGDGESGTSAPAFAELPSGRPNLAIPIAMGGCVVAVLYADQGPTNPDSRIPNSAALEVMARHAARCLEALTAFKVTRELTAPPAPTGQAVGVARVGTAADDKAAAQRYARLLVSEIKLYHEAEVVAGRRDRDLTTRLGGEIARARVLYEQRVAEDIRQTTDYFHAELVRTLAEGDESLLEQRA